MQEKFLGILKQMVIFMDILTHHRSPKDFAKYKEVKPSNQTFLVRKDMYEAIGKPDMRTPEGFLKALKMAKEKYPSVNGQPLIPLGLNEFTNAGNTIT